MDVGNSPPPSTRQTRRGFQFDLLTLMIAVALAAVGMALVGRSRNNPFVVFGLGAAYGFIGAHTLGRQRIVPGVLGAVFASWAWMGFQYLSLYFYPTPGVVDYLGPVISLLLISVTAAVEGLVVTSAIWIVVYLSQPFGDTKQK